MKDIHEEMDEVINLLNKQEEVKKLKEIENKMKEDLEVLKLSNDFSLAQSEYNSSLNHYSFESEEAKAYQKKLYETKNKLDNHPLVNEYYKYLSLVNEPLHYLEFNLFNKFSSKNHNCKK